MATLYVNGATGSDLVTRASNSISNPWATIGRAAWGSSTRSSPNPSEAAQAGDTVIIAAGNYSSSQSGSASRFDSFYNPANNGTVGNPITFQANGIVTLTISSYQGPQIGANSRSYITWSGFTIDESLGTSVPDTGPVVFNQSTGSILKNTVIVGSISSFGDNHNGVRIEACNGVTIQNCWIRNIHDALDDGNASCVTLYQSINCIIEYCTFNDSFYGVFIKGANPGPITVRRNIAYDCLVGFKFAGIEAGGSDCYENILYDCSAAFTALTISGGNPHPVNVRIINNTVHCSGAGSRAFDPGGDNTNFWDGIEVKNNIFLNGQWSWFSDTMPDAEWQAAVGPAPSPFEIEHNVYFGATSVFSRVPSNRDFPTWKTALGCDLASPASLEANPLFVDSTNRDYRLQAGSPARMGCPDILGLYGGATRDAGARQFADNGAPIQIGYVAGEIVEPVITMRYARIRGR